MPHLSVVPDVDPVTLTLTREQAEGLFAALEDMPVYGTPSTPHWSLGPFVQLADALGYPVREWMREAASA